MSEILTFQVDLKSQGDRIDRFLSSRVEKTSRQTIQEWIENSAVTVNGQVVRSSYRVKNRDQISVVVPIVKTLDIQPLKLELDIKFEDDDLIVVHKPAGLVVHPAAGHFQDTLVNALVYHSQSLSQVNPLRPGIVHRLDKETSGLLVVAKNDWSHNLLAQQFSKRSIIRSYRALTMRPFFKAKGIIKNRLARHPKHRQKFASVKSETEGKVAITHFEKLYASTKYSYMKLKLETGRTHQIRVHMSELRHSIVGDSLYGGPHLHKLFGQPEIEDRFFLHAKELGFIHPKTNKLMHFKQDWPLQDAIRIEQLLEKKLDDIEID